MIAADLQYIFLYVFYIHKTIKKLNLKKARKKRMGEKETRHIAANQFSQNRAFFSLFKPKLILLSVQEQGNCCTWLSYVVLS